MPTFAKSFQKLPTFAKSCHKLTTFATCWKSLPTFAKVAIKLPKVLKFQIVIFYKMVQNLSKNGAKFIKNGAKFIKKWCFIFYWCLNLDFKNGAKLIRKWCKIYQKVVLYLLLVPDFYWCNIYLRNCIISYWWQNLIKWQKQRFYWC